MSERAERLAREYVERLRSTDRQWFANIDRPRKIAVDLLEEEFPELAPEFLRAAVETHSRPVAGGFELDFVALLRDLKRSP